MVDYLGLTGRLATSGSGSSRSKIRGDTLGESDSGASEGGEDGGDLHGLQLGY